MTLVAIVGILLAQLELVADALPVIDPESLPEMTDVGDVDVSLADYWQERCRGWPLLLSERSVADVVAGRQEFWLKDLWLEAERGKVRHLMYGIE